MIGRLLSRSLFGSLLLLAGCSSREETKSAAVPTPATTVSLEKNADPAPVGPIFKKFREAVLQEVPEGEQRPPDATVTGKSIGKLYERIAGKEGAPGLFDQVRLADPQGRKIVYHAVVKTDLGDIRLELLSESAPNHVRSFIALARAGYFDGLPFHRSVRETPGEKAEASIEAGCPLGTGEHGYGSIGYWLRPEIDDELTHDAGVVGAWHGLAPKADQPGTFEDVENAACKFYIALSKSPWRDLSYTIFGKTVQGLDVAHKINQRPNRAEPGMQEIPQQPVVIRQVIIEEQPSAAPVARQS